MNPTAPSAPRSASPAPGSRRAALDTTLLPPLTLAMFLALALSACSVSDPLVFDKARFDSARAAWQSLNAQNYQFEYYSVGFTYEHLRVTVTGGTQVSSVPLENSDILTYNRSIDDLFRVLENEWKEGLNESRMPWDFYLTSIDVDYDPVSHFPARVTYGYHIPQGLEVDGNFGYQIRNFQRND